MWLLTDTKTGRFWRYATENMAVRAASALGLKDWSLEWVAK